VEVDVMGKLIEPRKPTKPIPELRDGDRLNTKEFMRRYEATPEGTRAELINGVVHVNRWIEIGANGKERVMPPISCGGHRTPQIHAGFWAQYYAIHTMGVEASAPTTVIFSPTDSAPEPDALLRLLPEYGGITELQEDDYLHGPPEFIVEIANTSAYIDLGSKLEIYERDGVPEYLVWRTRQQIIDWFYLNRNGEYAPIVPDADGILKSRVFPGLWLDVTAMTTSDMAKVLAVVQQGIASPEHAKFVEKLRKKAAKKKR
jgi:Uma2 family endonuclease